MNSKDTYISFLPHKAIRVLGADKAILAKTICEMCESSESGSCEISQEYLIEITGYEKRSLQNYLKHLRFMGIISSTGGVGRGHNAIFVKGENYDTFFAINDEKNVPFYDQEKAKKNARKGENFAHYYNISNNISSNAPAQAREAIAKDAAADGDLKKGSPRQGEDKKECKEKPTKESEKMIQQQFEEFWRLFQPKDEYQNRKNRCEGVWSNYSPEWRESILKELSAGKKHRDNPLHYLQYYTPADVTPEISIFRNHEAALGDAIREAYKGGRALAFVKGEGLHIQDNFVYVYLTDAIAQGLEIIRTIPAAAINQVTNQ